MADSRTDADRRPAIWMTPLVVGLVIVALDQATKWVIRSSLGLHDAVSVVDGFLRIVHVRNPGAAFSLLAGAPDWFRAPLLIGITVVAVAVVLYVVAHLEPGDRFLRIALGGVLGGAVGNLVDRLAFGEVIDFIDVYWGDLHWPAFNVADSAISIAVVAILIHSFSRDRRDPAGAG